MLIRVVAPHFTAGVLTEGEARTIILAAPILRWTEGKTVDELWRWCKKKGYECERIRNRAQIEKGD